MSAKEDILEQLVEEFLIHQGYFVRHNVKFLPRRDHPDFVSNQDSNHSDIDVLAYHPTLVGSEKVLAVSCKSWQAGFDPKKKIAEIEGDKRVSGRIAWKGFRELARPKWSEAFVRAIHDATGQREFTYITAVTKLLGDRATWENHEQFKSAMCGNPIRILTLEEMLTKVSAVLTTTMAGTELGRTLQLFRAAGLRV
jgi:hypothetical protein